MDEGALEELEAALQPPAGLEVDLERVPVPGGLRVTLTYRAGGELVGTGKVDLLEREARFVSLRLAPAAQRRGITAALADRFVAWCGRHGLERVVASPADEASAAIFRRAGAVDVERGLVAWPT